jgi:small GTP-binding protein
MHRSSQITWKIIIVGNSGVGKTTLLHQYLSKKFKSKAETTIGSNFFVKYLNIPEKKELIALQVWDLAGQERFKWVRNAFYKGAKGIVYVFDLTDKNSFDVLMNWKHEVENIIGLIPCVLVGNKLDLIDTIDRSIENNESDFLKRELGAVAYIETSAKLGTNVDEAFYNLAVELIKKY